MKHRRNSWLAAASHSSSLQASSSIEQEIKEVIEADLGSRPQQVWFDGKELIALVADREAQMHSARNDSAILSTCANSQLKREYG